MLVQLWTWITAANPLAVLSAFALAFLAILLLLQQIKPDAPGQTLADRLAPLRKNLGVAGLPLWLFLLAAAVWLVILVMLLAGVLIVLWSVLTDPLPTDNTETWNFRFLLAQLAAVTTVLGVVVAFPVTLNRLRLTSDDNTTKAAALYNEKINAALADLHAQKQVTEWKRKEGRMNVWQDDIVRRNGAIDRLEALAHENTKETPRIARMLATYLRELSAVYPAKDPPANPAPEDLRVWAQSLKPARSDMENAAQTLGRLLDVEGMTREKLAIDLHGANLQRFQLNGARLEGADLGRAHLEGAYLIGAHLEGAYLIGAHLEGADLFEAHLEGADLRGARINTSTDFSAANTTRAALKSVDVSIVNLTSTQVNSMFGDGSVILPKGMVQPGHWPSADLDWSNFYDEWALYKSDPAAYIPPQDR